MAVSTGTVSSSFLVFYLLRITGGQDQALLRYAKLHGTFRVLKIPRSTVGDNYCRLDITVVRRMASPVYDGDDGDGGDGNSDDGVSDFYRNATVLITGGTGFLGKVLIEKLMRTYMIKRIYLLVRKKHGRDVNNRLEEFFKDTLFDSVRTNSKDTSIFAKKVIGIHTDFKAFDLGIAPHERHCLQHETQIVFNIVASVKFNERLRDVIDINLVGTKRVVELAHKMKNLKSFVHISTIYSNCHRNVIGEKVYEQTIGYERIVQLARTFDDTILEQLHDYVVGEMPNTYTMSKRYAENLVNHCAFSLPAGIFRPPIVLSMYKEPIAGWTDNLNGPSSICVWAAKGFVHCIHGDASKRANLVPVDYCINALIASAWDVSLRFKMRMRDQSEMPVYNYIYEENNLSWGEYMRMARDGLHHPFDNSLWYFSYSIVRWRPLFRLIDFFVHTMPGYLLDMIAMCARRKRIFTRAYRKLDRILKIMSFFGLRDWRIQNDNVRRLYARLSAQERNDLPFDLRTIDWPIYFEHYLAGIKRHYLNERMDNGAQLKKHNRRLFLVHHICKYTFRLICIGTTVRLLRQLWRQSVANRSRHALRGI